MGPEDVDVVGRDDDYLVMVLEQLGDLGVMRGQDLSRFAHEQPSDWVGFDVTSRSFLPGKASRQVRGTATTAGGRGFRPDSPPQNCSAPDLGWRRAKKPDRARSKRICDHL
jgi:hypothetical protein